jgi:hypothetical protein
MPGTITRLVTRGRAIPWLALYESGKWVYGRGRRAWENLEQPERERLGGLLRKSKGRRSNLSTRERDELWSLVKKAVTGKG